MEDSITYVIRETEARKAPIAFCVRVAKAEMMFLFIMKMIKSGFLKIGGNFDYTGFEDLMLDDKFEYLLQGKLQSANLAGVIDYESTQIRIEYVFNGRF